MAVPGRLLVRIVSVLALDTVEADDGGLELGSMRNDSGLLKPLPVRGISDVDITAD